GLAPWQRRLQSLLSVPASRRAWPRAAAAFGTQIGPPDRFAPLRGSCLTPFAEFQTGSERGLFSFRRAAIAGIPPRTAKSAFGSATLRGAASALFLFALRTSPLP